MVSHALCADSDSPTAVASLAIIALLILFSRRIFRKHRLGKAESPPSSPGFQIPNSPFSDRIARSMNQINIQREADLGLGMEDRAGGLKGNADGNEFTFDRKEMDGEKWYDESSYAASFSKEKVEESNGLLGNVKSKIRSVTSVIKGIK